MSRSQFLGQLRLGLAGLNPSDVDDIIADYSAHFDEGLAHGRSEEEIAAKLGDPVRLARELRAEAHVKAWQTQPSARNFFGVIFAFIGLAAVDFVILLPILGWLALFALITMLVCIGLCIGGLGMLLSLLHAWPLGTLPVAFARFLGGCALLGLGTGIGASLLLFVRWVVDLLVKFARLHYRLLKQAE